MATKPVTDLVPGDRLIITAVKTVVNYTRDAAEVTITYDDGTVQTWATAGDPAVEVDGQGA